MQRMLRYREEALVKSVNKLLKAAYKRKEDKDVAEES
jgi:hypothetical protein